MGGAVDVLVWEKMEMDAHFRFVQNAHELEALCDTLGVAVSMGGGTFWP